MVDITAPLLDFPVNWDSSYRVSYEYKTDMITSRSGREQRRALRTAPRKTIEYQSLIKKTELHRFNRLFTSAHHSLMNTPEFTRSTFTTDTLADGNSSVSVLAIPSWLMAGSVVVLNYERRMESHLVVEAAGDQVSFSEPASRMWPPGTKLHPVLQGNLAQQIRVPHSTNDTAAAAISFDVDPGSEPVMQPAAASVLFKGREVFLMKPNWISDINWTFEHEIETVDYGRGRLARFVPVEFETKLFEANYLARTANEATDLLAFFKRQRGQVGEFHMPTWTDDMVLAAPAFTGTNTMRIQGREVSEVYEDHPVYRTIVVFLRDGRRAFARISGFIELSGDSLLVLEDNWPIQIDPANVLMICWMPVWRSATDTLTVEWFSDAVAQTKLSLKTLEDLPVT